MQIAVAAPHLPPHPPRLEQRTASRKLFLYTRLERVDLRRIEARRTAIAQNAQIGRGDFLHDRGAAMIGARLGLIVKLGDVRREFEYHRGRESAGARDRVEQLILIEASHDKRPNRAVRLRRSSRCCRRTAARSPGPPDTIAA